MFLLPFSFSDHNRIRRPSQHPTAKAMADLFAMASTAQQPVQGDGPSVTIDPQEQSSNQPAPSQTSTRDSEDFDLNLFNTLNPSGDELMGAILSEFNHNPDSFHDAAATKMQQPPTPASTDGSGNDEQKQRPTRRLNNSDMIKSIMAKQSMSHETRCHQRQPTNPIAQSRKRKLDEPAVACPAPASLEQHPHKLPRTGNYSIADMFMAKAFNDIARLQTPGSSYATLSNWQQSGSSQANPLVLDDDGDNDDANGGITAQQHGGPSSSYNPIAKPATLPETTTEHAASNSSSSSSSAAVAFAVEETIPLPPTIGGHAHRTFAFSPACQISIRRGGRLLSIKKKDQQQQVLHFTNSSKSNKNNNNNNNNNNESITKNHTGDGKLPEEARGSCVHGSSSSSNSSSVGEDEDKETERRNDGDQEVSRFKVVGFGPCSRCCQSAPAGRLCDRGFPCRSCLAEAGGDVGVAMEKCLLPVVARPEGAIDGDELLKRGVKVVRPGMVVAAVEQVKVVEGLGVGEH